MSAEVRVEAAAGPLVDRVVPASSPSAYAQVLALQRPGDRADGASPSVLARVAAEAVAAPAGGSLVAAGMPIGDSCPSVPLPTTLPLLAIGLAAMAAWPRRSRR